MSIQLLCLLQLPRGEVNWVALLGKAQETMAGLRAVEKKEGYYDGKNSNSGAFSSLMAAAVDSARAAVSCSIEANVATAAAHLYCLLTDVSFL